MSIFVKHHVFSQRSELRTLRFGVCAHNTNHFRGTETHKTVSLPEAEIFWLLKLHSQSAWHLVKLKLLISEGDKGY